MTWSRQAAAAEIIRAYPECNSPPTPGAVRAALYSLAGPGFDARFPTEQAAADFLLDRVRAFAASRLMRTTPQAFRPGGGRWLKEEGYDSPPEVWDRAYAGGAAANDEPETAAQRELREYRERKAHA